MSTTIYYITYYGSCVKYYPTSPSKVVDKGLVPTLYSNFSFSYYHRDLTLLYYITSCTRFPPRVPVV